MSNDKGSEDGLGSEGTIPNTDDGIALGHDPEATTFEPEEEGKPVTGAGKDKSTGKE